MAQLAREFISGHPIGTLLSLRGILGPHSTVITPDVARRMMLDPIVSGSVRLLQVLILSHTLANGFSVVAKDQDDAESVAIAEFVQEQINSINFFAPCLEMVRKMLVEGYGIAESVFELAGDSLVLRAVKPKSSTLVGFVVDEFGNIKGFRSAKNSDLIPVEKFWWVSHDGGLEDSPQGASALEPAYNYWYFKTSLLPEWFKFLQQFGTPGLVGRTPDEAQEEPQIDADGNPVTDGDGNELMVTAEQALLRALLAFGNSTALALPHGTEVDFLQSEGDGAAFLAGHSYADRQIATAILGSSRTTLEAEHGSKADSTSGNEVTQAIVAKNRLIIQESIEQCLLKVLVEANFGPGKPVPRIVLSSSIVANRVEMIKAGVAALQAGMLTIEEVPDFCAMVGLPVPDIEKLRQAQEDSDMVAKLISGEIGKATNPDPDPQQ
ncbi:MAG: DUF935 family protein [Chthonomonas sp.]|nr:DUF935 family protein [Chthonomonas sp.]